MELTMKETTLSLSMLPNSNSVSLLLFWIFSSSKTGPFQFILDHVAKRNSSNN